MIDAAETEAEAHTLYHKVSAALPLLSPTHPMKTFSIDFYIPPVMKWFITHLDTEIKNLKAASFSQNTKNTRRSPL